MARQARGEFLDPFEVQVVHCTQRCIRRAYLCGQDAVTNKSFEHRREWVRDRMEFLSSVFAIDCLTFAVMHNHLHVVLRSRPDVVKSWSDQDVARRWLRLFPRRREEDGSPCEPAEHELNALLRDKSVLAERRRRLSDISWWMRCLAEVIARRANREDECTGRFWEGRFKAQVLLDESSLLACAAYVDLNPIRAAIATTPETSDFTGVKARLDDMSQRSESARGGTHAWERSDRRRQSGWLCPLEIDERSDDAGLAPCQSGRRCSQKGFLPISLVAYVALLDWTGRQIREDKAGSIPAELSPILERLQIDAENWCRLVRDYGQTFKRVAGTIEHIAAEATRRNQQWMQSPGNPIGVAH